MTLKWTSRSCIATGWVVSALLVILLQYQYQTAQCLPSSAGEYLFLWMNNLSKRQ